MSCILMLLPNPKVVPPDVIVCLNGIVLLYTIIIIVNVLKTLVAKTIITFLNRLNM